MVDVYLASERVLISLIPQEVAAELDFASLELSFPLSVPTQSLPLLRYRLPVHPRSNAAASGAPFPSDEAIFVKRLTKMSLLRSWCFPGVSRNYDGTIRSPVDPSLIYGQSPASKFLRKMCRTQINLSFLGCGTGVETFLATFMQYGLDGHCRVLSRVSVQCPSAIFLCSRAASLIFLLPY